MGFETCGPNEAMIVSGCGYNTPAMIPGGRVWVWPKIQRIQRIGLNTMTLQEKYQRISNDCNSCVLVSGVNVLFEPIFRFCDQCIRKEYAS